MANTNITGKLRSAGGGFPRQAHESKDSFVAMTERNAQADVKAIANSDKTNSFISDTVKDSESDVKDYVKQVEAEHKDTADSDAGKVSGSGTRDNDFFEDVLFGQKEDATLLDSGTPVTANESSPEQSSNEEIKKEEVEHSTLPKETIENSGVNVNKAPSLINVEKE